MPALRSWLDLAQEVVVVDSESKDGTVELLQSELQHPNLRFLSHPPGLYQSWNFGIRHLNTEFAYISTAGDAITREGIQSLISAAQSLQCDVVISKPEILNLEGQPVDLVWPIDDIISSLRISSPRKLNRVEALVFSWVHGTDALTGSCASDLFRRECLTQFPFPIEFGTAGDGAWGVMHAAQVAWAVVPGRVSRFVTHPAAPGGISRPAQQETKRMDIVMREAVSLWRQIGAVTEEELARAGWPEIGHTFTTWLDAKLEFDACRRAKWPWSLDPLAWRIRNRRQKARRRLHSLKTSVLNGALASAASALG
jgi:hypothetical protein